MKISIPIWWINNWLRFTGVRFYVETPSVSERQALPEDEVSATRIGLMWWGSPFNDGS